MMRWWFSTLALSCSAAAPSRQIGLNHSFLGVWRSWGALYPRKVPSAHDARETSRYWGLWGPFWVPFRLQSPPRDNSEMCSRGVSWPDLVDSDDFLSISSGLLPFITVWYSVRDGNRALTHWNRLKIDPCGSRSDFDRNLRFRDARSCSAATPNHQIDPNHSFFGVWVCLGALFSR